MSERKSAYSDWVVGEKPLIQFIDLRCLYLPHREQARSHSGSAYYTKFMYTLDQVWERACSR